MCLKASDTGRNSSIAWTEISKRANLWWWTNDKQLLFPLLSVKAWAAERKRKTNKNVSSHMELESQNWRVQGTPESICWFLHQRVKGIFPNLLKGSKISTNLTILRKQAFPQTPQPDEGEEDQEKKETWESSGESGELTLKNTAKFYLNIFCAFIREHLLGDRKIGRDFNT